MALLPVQLGELLDDFVLISLMETQLISSLEKKKQKKKQRRTRKRIRNLLK
jgi:hypothetical protein